MRGGTITFNLYDPDGHLLDYRRVEELATDRRISIRTGCFCNPGAGETAEGLTEEDMLAGAARRSRHDAAALPAGHPAPRRQERRRDPRLARASPATSPMSKRSCEFVAGFRDQTRLTMGEVTFDVASCRVITRRQLTPELGNRVIG